MAESIPAHAQPLLASPLSLLLEEEGRGDRQAEEVLLLTYTSDLGFFEAFGLGAAQACGARVSIVSDARMSAPDPRAARRAGRTYLPGQVICDGAFHPKLVLIAGPRRVTGAIGSGNTTIAGWQANAELWTVLRGDETSCPSALADLATWLRRLPDFVRCSRGVPEALARAAAHLEALVAGTAAVSDDGIRLVSTSPGAIFDQLPSGPVEELCLCAPFHDPGAVALRALIERLRPGTVRICYQPELTQLDGPAIAALAANIDIELRIDAEQRYRHGKLIEWATEGTRWALTGSPNLSGAALLRGLSTGGNCELGVITPIAETLLPAGGRVPLATVHEQRFVIRSRGGGPPLLLGATRVEQGLHVLFARPLPRGAHLELSHAASPPESWERAGDVPAGVLEITLTVPADGGSRIRLVTVAGEGMVSHSNIVFVVDPIRVLQRAGANTARPPDTRADDLFANNPRLAERVLADLAALAEELPPAPLRVPAATAADDGRVTTRADSADGWEAYLDKCAGRIGHPLLRFALGLPVLPGGADAAFEPMLRVSWADETVSDAEAGLADENIDEVAAEQELDQTALPPLVPDLTGAAATVHRRYRRWAQRLTELAPQLGAPGRMLVTRLLLWTVAAGAWDREDHAWVRLLSSALQSLGGANLPAQAEPQVASLAAVGLSVLRAEAPRRAHTEETIAFDKAAQAVAHLLPAAEPDYVEEYARVLGSAFGAAVAPESIETLASDVVQNDPVDDALWALVELNRDAHRHGQRLLHVVGSSGNPLWRALEAVGHAQDAGLVGAWASSTRGRWMLCLWRRPDLYTVEGGEDRPLWRHYRLTGLATPLSLAHERSLDGATELRNVPLIDPIPEARTALEQLGLKAPQPPANCIP
ncbi:hypothetical protein [Geodermatophilus sp. TF02-6]|uniref:hypothetical protein n=1 Tax=Geodermatophilus sp. TF02-6 TaxID=2250575 RepID=UPI0013140125|nr:hypothetical protein [Geodermatophilus sp. TF02-6]